MKLIEFRDKIDAIIKENPSWADCERIGTVISKDEDGFCEMEWIKDFKPICCDGHGMVAFQIVLEDDYYSYIDEHPNTIIEEYVKYMEE